MINDCENYSQCKIKQNEKVISLIYALALLNFISFTAHAQTYCSSKGTNTSLGYIKEVKLLSPTILLFTIRQHQWQQWRIWKLY